MNSGGPEAPRATPGHPAARLYVVRRRNPLDRRFMGALLLSLVAHAWLVKLNAGGDGLLGLGALWQDRRVLAPDLRVTLVVPAPAVSKVPAPVSIPPPIAPPPTAPAPAAPPRAARPTQPLMEPEPAAGPEVKAMTAVPEERLPAPLEIAAPAADPWAALDSIPPLMALEPSSELAWIAPTAEAKDAVPAGAQAPVAVDAEGARLEAAKMEAARLEAARLESARFEAARLEADKLEAARLESARLEAARLEAEKLEAARRESARLEAARLEAEKLEAARLESARLEAARLEAEKLEAARLEAARLEAARLETARLEAAKLEAERLEASRLEAAKLEAAKLEAAKLEAAKLEAAKREAARLAAAKPAPTAEPGEDPREARLRRLAKVLEEEAKQREAEREGAQLPLSLSTARRYRLFGRGDPNPAIERYAMAWSRKIEMNMRLDALREVLRQPYRSPMVTVAIRGNGTVETVRFVVSSGVPALDEAIRNVVMGQAPYAVFPPALALEYDVIEIRRTWHFDSAIRLN